MSPRSPAVLLAASFMMAPPLRAAQKAPAAEEMRVHDQSEDELEAFFLSIKPGAFVIIEMKKGPLVQGRLHQYDDYYNTVWIEPAGEAGFLKRKSYRMGAIRNARLATTNDISDPKRRIDVDRRYLLITPE